MHGNIWDATRQETYYYRYNRRALRSGTLAAIIWRWPGFRLCGWDPSLNCIISQGLRVLQALNLAQRWAEAGSESWQERSVCFRSYDWMTLCKHAWSILELPILPDHSLGHRWWHGYPSPTNSYTKGNSTYHIIFRTANLLEDLFNLRGRRSTTTPDHTENSRAC